jgi:16S rRNA pseudouridine516 synthase
MKQTTFSMAEILFSQGFGSRRRCAAMVAHGEVKVCGVTTNLYWAIDEKGLSQLEYEVAGVKWPFKRKAIVIMHKPLGFECSQKPGFWPSVYTLLPPPLRERPVKGGKPGVQSVGRLDQDTTGLLIFTDDGLLLHQLTSPKHNVPKIYQVTCSEPVTVQQTSALLAGVVLSDSPALVRAVDVHQTSVNQLDLTITEGKYHQVKRMIVAAGNNVVRLHRSQVGSVHLGDLKPGEWRWGHQQEVQ